MHYVSLLSRLRLPVTIVNNLSLKAPSRDYAAKTTSTAGSIMGLGKGKKKIAGKMGAVLEKIVHPVETDTHKLTTYVCGSNIMTTGEDIKLKPDSEYPDWLWSLRVQGPMKLEEMDPSTKEYWVKVRTIGIRRNNQLARLRKF